MPKILLGAYTAQNEQFVNVIKSCLMRQGKNYKNLARRARTCEKTVFERYKNMDKLPVSELRAYIQEAKIPEEDVLNFLYLERSRQA